MPVKTTVRGVILQINEQEKTYLDNLMDRFCAAVRWSYKRLLDGWRVQDIRLAVQGKFSLNSRQANDGVFTSTIGILKYQQQYGISNHEAASYVIARRALGYSEEKLPKPLINRFVKEKNNFSKQSNWKQWSAIKKAIMAAIKKQTRQEVQSLVSWQHDRKQLLGTG